MSLDVKIIDGHGTGSYVSAQNFKDGKNGLIVATRPYNNYEFKRYPFISEEFGENMNIPLVFGDPHRIHNGGDDTLWTGSVIAGTSPDFNSDIQSYEGLYSIRWGNPNVGSIFQLLNTTIDLSNFIAITMWIYIQADWAANDSFSIYAFNGNQVGNRVLLQDYITYTTTNVWQKITIPLSDMNLYTQEITAFRIQNEQRNNPRSPTFFLDNIQLEAKGESGLGSFVVEAESNTWFFCHELILTMAMTYNGANGNLDYKKFLNLDTLENGINIVVRRFIDIRYQINFKSLGDFLNYGGFIDHVLYDGSDETFLKLKLPFDYPIVLQSEYNDRAIISINDDMSNLTSFRATARGGLEYKINEELSFRVRNIY